LPSGGASASLFSVKHPWLANAGASNQKVLQSGIFQEQLDQCFCSSNVLHDCHCHK